MSQPSTQSPTNPDAESQVIIPTDAEVLMANSEVWHQEYEAAFNNAARLGVPLSVIIGDATALKAVNDELGHSEGDNLLNAVRNAFLGVVTSSLRTEDSDKYPDRPHDIIAASSINFESFSQAPTPGRIGGDEYAIVLPNTDEAGAARVKERISEGFSAHLMGPAGETYRNHGINAGLALGYATLTPDMKTPSELLSAADKAMYIDKMSQLAPLTDEQLNHLLNGLKHLVEAKVRPRDLPRYIEFLGAQGLLGAELELALVKPGIAQEADAVAG